MHQDVPSDVYDGLLVILRKTNFLTKTPPKGPLCALAALSKQSDSMNIFNLQVIQVARKTAYYAHAVRKSDWDVFTLEREQIAALEHGQL